MPTSSLRRSFAFCFSLAMALCLAGCSDDGTITLTSTPAVATGNWQISSTDPAAQLLPSLSGELSGTSTSISGVFHADTGAVCTTPSAAFPVTGTTDANNLVTLTSSSVAGGTLTVTGTLAADGKSLSSAAYTVSGGSCAFTGKATAQAQSFSPVTGTYSGSFSDPDGQVITVSANFTQTPDADTSGNFSLSGSGTFPSNPCFSSPVPVTNAQVTGGTFTFTYADPVTANSVVANGTFSADGSTLTVTKWKLTGSCGPDSGTGLMARPSA